MIQIDEDSDLVPQYELPFKKLMVYVNELSIGLILGSLKGSIKKIVEDQSKMVKLAMLIESMDTLFYGDLD